MTSLIPSAFRPFRLALIQLATSTDKQSNLRRARQLVKEACSNGANVVVLPECFNSPYGTQYFRQYAETIEPPQESYNELSAIAKENFAYLIGGSIPERKGAQLFNTSLIFSPTGALLAVHRKVHLFDIDVPGKIRFQESEVLTGGPSLTDFDTEYGKIGVAICYDVRFPEMAMIAARRGVVAMIYPGAFNLTTGPLHWELLARARAVDNQVYVAMCSPARDMNASYHAWGHSTIVDPNGEIVAKAGEGEEILYANLNPQRMQEVRQGIPVTTQRRFDVYEDIAKKSNSQAK